MPVSVFSNNNLAGKGLICAYGKNKDVYEAYLFFNNNYISKFLFLEKNKFRIRENEKRNYSVTNEFINLLPFKIYKKSLQVLDTEFDKIIGTCNLVNTHKEATNFMNKFKTESQESYDKALKGYEV
jgi:hypothetical protein